MHTCRRFEMGPLLYFEHDDSAAFLLEHGMSPRHMSWHEVTLLHDMAQSGDVVESAVLADHGADINAIDESTVRRPWEWPRDGGTRRWWRSCWSEAPTRTRPERVEYSIGLGTEEGTCRHRARARCRRRRLNLSSFNELRALRESPP